jgi:hypothetical protein
LKISLFITKKNANISIFIKSSTYFKKYLLLLDFHLNRPSGQSVDLLESGQTFREPIKRGASTMKMAQIVAAGALTASTLIPAGITRAEVSLNGGWHNPPGSELGLNLMFAGKHLALELGVGRASGGTYDADNKKNDDDADDTAAVATIGDIDLKYMFLSGKVRPYLQGGFGLALSGRAGGDSGASASTGDSFVGAGLLFKGSSVYGYIAAYTWEGSDIKPQAGIGVML